MNEELKDATYLGDGLYYSYDGYQVRLFTHNGLYSEHEVFLESAVLDNFLRVIEQDGLIEKP